MPASKKSAHAKKSEPQKKVAPPKKEIPKKEEPKKEVSKKETHATLASLREEFIADCKASPSDAPKLKAQYIKARHSLRGTLKSNK
jgi:hypothetical protein